MAQDWTEQQPGTYTITTGNWTDATNWTGYWNPPLHVTDTAMSAVWDLQAHDATFDRCNPVADESEGRYIAPSTGTLRVPPSDIISPLSTDNQIAALQQMIRDLTVAHADLLRDVEALRDMIRAAPQPTVPAARLTNTLDRSGYYR